MKFSERAMNIRKSEILAIGRKVKEMEGKGKEVIKLHIGDTYKKTPIEIVEKAKEALDSGRTGYEHIGGAIPELKEAVKRYLKREYGVSCEEDNIIAGPSIGLLNQTFDCILQQGKKCGMITPAWEVYWSQISETLAQIKQIPASEDDGVWRIKKEGLGELENLDALILNNPNNPTASKFEKEDLDELVSELDGKDFPIIEDLCYDRLCWSPLTPLFKYKEVRNRTIAIGSFSKSYRMTGWRVGFAVVPEKKLLEKLQEKARKDWTCVPPFIQYAAAYALSEDFKPKQVEWKNEVKETSLYAFKKLEDMGMVCCKPLGTIYLFIKINSPSVKFVDYLIEKYRVSAVPGIYFGSNGEGYFRITTVSTTTENLDEGIERIAEAWKEYQT